MRNAHRTRHPIATTASHLLRVLRGEHASDALLVLARSDTSAGHPAFPHGL